METTSVQVLLPLISRRYQGFSDAAEATLSVLGGAMPGTMLLGQLDPDEGLCRVIDLHGPSIEGLAPGSSVPLAGDDERSSGTDPLRNRPGAALDRAFLAGISIDAALTVPLEMSDGNLVAVIGALSPEEGVYGPRDVLLLGLAARLLGYEWESVRSRAEIRRLRERLRDGERSDPVTGLANREGLLELLTREWKLAQRGNLDSMVVACRVEAPGHDGRDAAAAMLALKDAAEVLSGSIRSTDHAGRVAEMTLAAVMIGCNELAGARAFVSRFEAALSRVSASRGVPLGLSWGARALGDSRSAAEALEAAERAATSSDHDAGGLVGSGAAT